MLALAATAGANAATIAVILAGLVRLIARHGVGLQAMLGALAVYLLVGLTFAFVIGALAVGCDGSYFAQGRTAVRASASSSASPC